MIENDCQTYMESVYTIESLGSKIANAPKLTKTRTTNNARSSMDTFKTQEMSVRTDLISNRTSNDIEM
jgi:hypothetical protein